MTEERKKKLNALKLHYYITYKLVPLLLEMHRTTPFDYESLRKSCKELMSYGD